MLIDKIESCTSSVNELSTLRSNALSLKTYETSVNKLTAVGALITDLVSTIQEMNKHGFCRTNISAEDLEKMRDAVVTCAQAVNSMSLNSNDVNAITTVFQSQKSMLTILWQTTAKAYVEPIRNYLVIIQSFAGNKGEIAELIKVLATGAAAEPSAAIVKTLVANVKKANDITSNFQMTDGVREFLRKAKTGRATYADITDDVAKWIADHGLGSRIKLTF